MTLAVLFALLLIAVVACKGSDERAAGEGTEARPSARTSAEAKPCTPVEVRELVVSFIGALITATTLPSTLCSLRNPTSFGTRRTPLASAFTALGKTEPRSSPTFRNATPPGSIFG
jgi:hypothetical protein